MKRNSYFLLCCVLAIFTACEWIEDIASNKDEFESKFEYEFNKDVKYYDEDLSSYISLVNDTTMLILPNMPDEYIPKTGDVILCPSTDSTPRGFLRRVVSIEEDANGMTISTEPATIADAFYHLKFEQRYDYAECVKEFRDSLGNEIPFEILEGSVSEQMDSVTIDSLDNITTKAKGDLDLGQKTIKLDISNRFFQGSAFMESEIYVKFDIGFGKVNEVTYVIDKKVGVKGKAFISSGELGGKDYEDDFSIPFLDKSIPFGTPIGPPLMQFFPSLNLGISFIANGSLSLEGEVNYILEDTKSSYSYINGVEHKEVINNLQRNGSWMKMVSLEAEGEFGLKGTVGIELRLWNGDLLAFGGEAALWYGMETKASISMSDNALLIQSPQVNVHPSLSAALYIESYFINNRQHRIEAKVERSFEDFYISLLPEFEFEEIQSNTQLTVKPKVEPICIMEVSQQGFALFAEENPGTPLVNKTLPPSTIIAEVPTAAYEDLQIEPEQIGFSLPSDTDKEYFVKPYVIADGKYYYGKGGRWVDLGLPSGILWAKYNVGATSPEEYGDYFSWGTFGKWDEVDVDDIYNHNRGNDISGSEFDVANIRWGDGARIPTVTDLDELIENCIFTLADYNNTTGNRVTGLNGNSIFLPFAGCYDEGVEGAGLWAEFWSSSLNGEDLDHAYLLHIGSSYSYKWDENWIYIDEGLRELSLTIRPVKDKETDTENL